MAGYFVAVDPIHTEYYEYLEASPNRGYRIPYANVSEVPLQPYTLLPCVAPATVTSNYLPNAVNAGHFLNDVPMHLYFITGSGDYVQNEYQEPRYQHPQYQAPLYQSPHQRCEISELLQTTYAEGNAADETDPYGTTVDIETDRQFTDNVKPDPRERGPSVVQSRKKNKKHRHKHKNAYRAEQGYLVEEPTDDDEPEPQPRRHHRQPMDAKQKHI